MEAIIRLLPFLPFCTYTLIVGASIARPAATAAEQFGLRLQIISFSGARPVILAIVAITIIQIGVGDIAKNHVLIFMRQLTDTRTSDARPYNCHWGNPR